MRVSLVLTTLAISLSTFSVAAAEQNTPSSDQGAMASCASDPAMTMPDMQGAMAQPGMDPMMSSQPAGMAMTDPMMAGQGMPMQGQMMTDPSMDQGMAMQGQMPNPGMAGQSMDGRDMMGQMSGGSAMGQMPTEAMSMGCPAMTPGGMDAQR